MAEIYEKGLVILPKSMREAFKMHPGTKVDYRLEKEGILVMPAGNSIAEMRALRKEMAKFTDRQVENMIRETEKRRIAELVKNVR